MKSEKAPSEQLAPELRPATALPPYSAGAQDLAAIVLVHWQIRPECEAEFLDYWRTVSRVGNRVGLAGEFLSEVVAADATAVPFVTWLLSEPDAVSVSARHFVNVGLWLNEAVFVKEIAGDFGDQAPLRPFELRRRRRLLLKPECWRIGEARLPRGDSAEVR